MQRALMQFFKPENWFTVREALIEAGRADLIGNGCDCLIPANPPKEAMEVRRKQANEGDHYHTVANPAKGEPAGERGAEPPKTGLPARADVGAPPRQETQTEGRRFRPATVANS